MVKIPHLDNTRSHERRAPAPSTPKPEWGWMRGVEFEGPEELAACERFLYDVEAFLDEESRRTYGSEKKNESATAGNAASRVLSRQ